MFLRDGSGEGAKIFLGYITDSWDVLSTITSEGFNQFRDHLGTASGQLSFMYRHVEFVLGNKNRRLAEAHRNVPHVWPALRDAVESPNLYDDVIALLARRGLSIDAAALDRDWSVEYSPNASVESAWRQVYREAGADDELRRLGEALISLDQQFSLYRWRHFTSVERIIGYKPGTRWFGRHRMAGARHQTPFLPRDLGHQQLSVERDGHARIYGTSAT